MNNTYLVVMSNREAHDISATSAADAMQRALMEHPGETVHECCFGLTQGQRIELRAGRSLAAIKPGIIFEVPAHVALTVEQVAEIKRSRKKPVDKSGSMFDEAEIARESRGAIAARDGSL